MGQQLGGRFYFFLFAAVLTALLLGVRAARFWRRSGVSNPPAVSPSRELANAERPIVATLPDAEIHTYPSARHERTSPAELGLRPADLDPNAVRLLAEFEGRNIQDIDVRGCVRVSESTVLLLIRSRKGRPFNQQIWEEDWHRLDDSGFCLNVRTTEPIAVPGGIRLTIDLVERAVVDKLDIQGVHTAVSELLAKCIKTVVGGRYDKGQVHLDRLAMERKLRELGFESARVDYTVSVFSSHRQYIGGKDVEVEDAVTVTFEVKTGTRSRVESLQLKSATAFAKRDVLQQLELKPYGWFDPDMLESDRARIAAFYLRNGYADVSVDEAEVQRLGVHVSKLDGIGEMQVGVSYSVNEGAQYVVGGVELTGNAKFMNEELLRVIKTQTGALLVDETVTHDAMRLESYYADRGWSGTRVDPIRVRVTDPQKLKFSANVWDVRFRVTEGSKQVKLEFVDVNGARNAGVLLGEKPPGPADAHEAEQRKFVDVFETKPLFIEEVEPQARTALAVPFSEKQGFKRDLPKLKPITLSFEFKAPSAGQDKREAPDDLEKILPLLLFVPPAKDALPLYEMERRKQKSRIDDQF